MRSLLACLFAVSVLCFGGGCIHRPYKERGIVVEPLPPYFAKQFAMRKVAEEIQYVPHEDDAVFAETKMRHEMISLKRYVVDEEGGVVGWKTVKFACYIPKSDKPVPVVVINPISGGHTYHVEIGRAEFYYSQGWAAIIALRGKKPEVGKAEDLDFAVRQSTFDGFAIGDWIGTRKDLDKDRVITLGISLGAIKSQFAIALDPRLKGAILVVPGGDLPYIIMHSTDGLYRNKGVHKRRKDYKKKYKVTDEQMKAEVNRMVWNPIHVARSVHPRLIQMHVASCDTTVPVRTAWELYELYQHPDCWTYFATHYSIIPYIPLIQWESYRFSCGRFDIVPEQQVTRKSIAIVE